MPAFEVSFTKPIIRLVIYQLFTDNILCAKVASSFLGALLNTRRGCRVSCTRPVWTDGCQTGRVFMRALS